MLPSEALQFEFAKQTRSRGASYVQPGLIRLTQGTPDGIVAVVQGRSPYHVRIERRSDADVSEFVASCTCSYFRDERDACKHIWAALRFAEREGHLRGNGRPLARHNTFLALEHEPNQPPRPSPRGRAFARPAPRSVSAASAFLDHVTEHLATRELAARQPARYTDSTFLYVVDTFQSTDLAAMVVSVMHQPRPTQGSSVRPQPVKLTPLDIAHAPAADRRLLAVLAGAPFKDAHAAFQAPVERTATFSVPGPLVAELLPAMARTARVWLRAGPDPAALEPLTWDDGNAWRFEVRIDADGQNHGVTGSLVRDEVTVPLTERVCPLAGGLVIVRRTIARLEQTAAVPFLAELCRSGPVTVGPDDTLRLAEVIAQSGVEVTALPAALRIPDVRPRPMPRLTIGQRGERQAEWVGGVLSFDYDGLVIDELAVPSAFFDTNTRRFIRRDRQAEGAATNQLLALGFVLGARAGAGLELLASRLSNVVRLLVADGWHVEAEGVRYRAPLSVNLAVSSGIDWFDLHATVSFGDTTVPLADVLAALGPGGSTLRLDDGSVGMLPEQWLQQYSGLLAAGEVAGDTIRFRRSQAAMLDAMLAARETDTAIRVDEMFERARTELASFAEVAPLDPEPSFAGELRAYQRQGLGWFGFLRRFGFGGCLADDMGLGKTIMVLALLDARRVRPATEGEPRLPSLVVVPRSLVGNWLSEAARFTPALRVLDHSHGARMTEASTFSDTDVVLVTYGTLRRDIAALSTATFDYVILDEGQAIKNASTAASKAARLVRAHHRLALSGTPIENHLGELWSLFEFLNPGILGRSSMFRRFTTAGQTDAETTALVARGLRPFILRRTKRQVARELPEKTEQTIVCELLPKDRRLYDALRHHYRTTLFDRIDRQGLGKSRMHVLEALLRLRQAACHTGLIDPKRAADDSAKFDVLIPQLQEVVEEGHKAIVFSQFTTLLGLLRQRLDAAKLRYEYLDGKTRDRTARVQRFQEDPTVQLFLISLKAGGLGLNLTAAEYVFLLDPWWNPAAEAQAIDRAHRIGQTREVFAYRLIAKDTVEEKVLALQQSKRDLADAVLTADAVGLRDLSRGDLELLLS